MSQHITHYTTLKHPYLQQMEGVMVNVSLDLFAIDCKAFKDPVVHLADRRVNGVVVLASLSATMPYILLGSCVCDVVLPD